MDFVIRAVLPEEAYEYTICHIACWKDAYKGTIPDEYLNNMSSEIEHRTEKHKEALLESGDTKLCCAEQDGRMVGRLGFGGCRDDDKPGFGEIYAIYLLEGLWDKGFGRQLMDFALSELKRMGYHGVVVWVLDENTRAKKFYEKYGFAFDGTKKEIEVGKKLIEVRYILG